jgi:hypothetical protein
MHRDYTNERIRIGNPQYERQIHLPLSLLGKFIDTKDLEGLVGFFEEGKEEAVRAEAAVSPAFWYGASGFLTNRKNATKEITERRKFWELYRGDKSVYLYDDQGQPRRVLQRHFGAAKGVLKGNQVRFTTYGRTQEEADQILDAEMERHLRFRRGD